MREVAEGGGTYRGVQRDVQRDTEGPTKEGLPRRALALGGGWEGAGRGADDERLTW